MTQVAKGKIPADVLREIEAKLATIDGISTADAFALGRLIQEYGQATSGETASQMLTPLMDLVMKPKKDEPWK